MNNKNSNIKYNYDNPKLYNIQCDYWFVGNNCFPIFVLLLNNFDFDNVCLLGILCK